MRTTAWVVHRITGRLRLRLPDRKGDARFFGALAESVRALPGILGVRQNPLAASVVIEHEALESGQLDVMLGRLGLELIDGEPPAVPPLEVLLGGAAELERGLRGITGNGADLRTLGFLALATAALVQVSRGNALSAASSLIWHATDLLRDLPRGGQQAVPLEPGSKPER